MNASSFAFAAALLLPFFASAQTLVAVPAAQELVGSYPATAAARPASAGSVRYFGVVTSQDARHEQFGQLQRAFETFRPTLVVIEKPDLGTAETEATTIATKGVPGYTRLLAQRHQVPTERLDNPDAEYAYLRTKVDAEQLKLYYLLREAHRFQQANTAPPAASGRMRPPHISAPRRPWRSTPAARLPTRLMPPSASSASSTCIASSPPAPPPASASWW
ncbi:MAG: hypothetical protein EOO36_24960 [Cytophagaceae bacterium]|nr:MAG: hypothetical protein EOO36_24960 [Cytophagaceae bacterium]